MNETPVLQPPEQLSAPEPAASPPSSVSPQAVAPQGLLPAFQSLLYLLVVALFLMTFTAQPIRIPSASMEPTLLVGDFLLLDKAAVIGSSGGLLPPATVRRGDLIVFHDPVEDPSVHLVKRVVAIPGDRLHLRNGVLFLNGVAQQEPFAVHRASFDDPFRDDFPTLTSIDPGVYPSWWIHMRSLVQHGEITVPPNSYFVLGDNRNDSEDSRYWGFVPRSAIVGKPLLVYFSWKDPALHVRAADASGPGGPSGNLSGDQPLVPARVPAGPLDFARWDRTFQVVH